MLRIARATLAVSLTAVATVALASPVLADGSAPVTQPDEVTVVSASRAPVINMLANDSDPDGDKLKFAGWENDEAAEGIKLSANGNSQEVVVERSKPPGTYALTYYVYDGTNYASGSVTVHVLPKLTDSFTVTKLGRPGRLRLRNDNDMAVRFIWGAHKKKKPDGSVRVRSGASKTITVDRRSIVWLLKAGREFGPGLTRGIRLPAGGPRQPPGVLPHETVDWVYQAWWFEHVI